MKILDFTYDAGKNSATFNYNDDQTRCLIKNYHPLHVHMKKKLVHPETILEQNLRFDVIGYGTFNSIIHYILRDITGYYYLFTWNEFRQLENIVLEEERVRHLV